MTLARRISYGLAFAVVAVLAFGTSAFYATSLLTRAESRVLHREEVLGEVAQVFRLVVDEQNGVRGFALTGGTEFLDTYAQARANLPASLDRLRRAAADEPEQGARLDALARLAEQREAWLAEVIETRRAGGLEAAAKLVSKERIEGFTVRMRKLLAALEQTERERRREESAANIDAARFLFALNAVGTLVGLLIATLGALQLRRAVTRPTGRLLEGIEQMALGNLGVRLEHRGPDEFGRIARSFNQMVEKRHAAEQALVRANAFLSGLFRASPAPIIAFDEEGIVEAWNPAAEQVFGWTRQEIVGRHVPPILALRDSETSEGAYEGTRKDGTTFDARVSLATRASDGGRAGTIAIVEDVSERKRAAAALRESEERFRLAIDEAPIGMALVGTDGRFLRVNGALSDIVGYTKEELVSLTFQDITHPDDLETDLALAGQLFRGEIPRYQLEKRYIRKDGRIVNIMLSGSVVRAPDGRALYAVAQVEDITERKRAEERLRESETSYRELVEQASDAIFVANLDGRYTEVNPAACRMLGYSRDELVGKTIMDLIPAEDVARLAATREFLLTPGRIRVDEWRLRRKDGTLVPVEISAKILHDRRWQAFVRDISERKRAEEQLRRSEEALTRAQKLAHLGSYERDLRTGAVTRSAEVYAIYGVTPDSEWLGPDSLWHLVHPEDRTRVMATVSRSTLDGRPYEIEHRICRPDGAERVVRLRGEFIRENGAPVRMIGTILDITELRRAEREREESLRWLRQVMNQSPVGMLLLHGREGVELEANREATKMFGRPIDSVEEVANRLFSPDGEAVDRSGLPSTRALEGERIGWKEYLVRNEKGQSTPVAASAAPVVSDTGKLLGAIVALQDITAVKDLERLRAEWNSVVAHDLRQPLNTISMYAQLLEMNPEERLVRTGIEHITSSTKRLSRMVQDLLDLSRLDAGQLALAKKRLDIRKLVRASVERIAVTVPDRPVDVRVLGATPVVDADPDRIAQVMDNLLTNAVKYGFLDTPLGIDVDTGEKDVTVSVTNQGAGIAPEDVPHLFRRFHRTESARRSGVKGIGLGLYIVRELVEAHGGHVGARSTPGAETTFWFTLPLAAGDGSAR
jgi:PAS domain S-box-containing protein